MGGGKRKRQEPVLTRSPQDVGVVGIGAADPSSCSCSCSMTNLDTLTAATTTPTNPTTTPSRVNMTMDPTEQQASSSFTSPPPHIQIFRPDLGIPEEEGCDYSSPNKPSPKKLKKWNKPKKIHNLAAYHPDLPLSCLPEKIQSKYLGLAGRCMVHPSQFPPSMWKYWRHRFQLFSLYSSGCLLDEQSWYSVTPESVAYRIAKRCATDKIVLDLFAGAGGNSIQFAMTCNNVIAVEIDGLKIALAMWNAKVYGVQDRIRFIRADAIEFLNWVERWKNNMHQSLADIDDQEGEAEKEEEESFCGITKRDVLNIESIFLSPPWGGIEYAGPHPAPATAANKNSTQDVADTSHVDSQTSTRDEQELPIQPAEGTNFSDIRSDKVNRQSSSGPVSSQRDSASPMPTSAVVSAVPISASASALSASSTVDNSTGAVPVPSKSYTLASILPIHGRQLFRLCTRISNNIAYYLPRNTDLQELADLLPLLQRGENRENQPDGNAGQESVKLEENWLNQHKFSSVCAYYGQLASQWDYEKDDWA